MINYIDYSHWEYILFILVYHLQKLFAFCACFGICYQMHVLYDKPTMLFLECTQFPDLITKGWLVYLLMLLFS